MPDPIAVNSMFGRIARRYDRANHVLSAGIDFYWRRRLVAAVSETHPHDILDLATGSGDVAFALAKHLPAGISVLGVDFCEPMLEVARVKKGRFSNRQSDVNFRQGDATALLLEEKSVDAVTMAFGLRNVADRPRCLEEIRRVLRPGGSVFILEFSHPWAVLRPFYLAYLKGVLPWLARGLTGDRQAYEYLGTSIEGFPDQQALSREFEAAGYSAVRAVALTGGLVALHIARR